MKIPFIYNHKQGNTKRVWTKAVENIDNYSYNHNRQYFFIIWRRGKTSIYNRPHPTKKGCGFFDTNNKRETQNNSNKGPGRV